MPIYEVQGRRIERNAKRIVRDDVRLASAQDRDLAFEAAKLMVADGFTAWIFEIGHSAGWKTYNLLDGMPLSAK